MADGKIFTTGFSKMSERQLGLWDLVRDGGARPAPCWGPRRAEPCRAERGPPGTSCAPQDLPLCPPRARHEQDPADVSGTDPDSPLIPSPCPVLTLCPPLRPPRRGLPPTKG